MPLTQNFWRRPTNRSSGAYGSPCHTAHSDDVDAQGAHTEEAERRQVIRRTYENAVNAGDKNVYFLDGETFYGDTDRHCCSIDGIHPNDLGFYRMAQMIEPKIREILSAR